MRLAALAAASGAVALVLVAGPADASTHAAGPASVTGREVVYGALYGRAAWSQAAMKNPRIPVKFRGVVRTRAVINLGGGKSTTHSVRTGAGRFTVRASHTRTSEVMPSKAICRLQYTQSSDLVMRPRLSTGAFAGATGHGRVRTRFTFNYPKRHNGTCNYSNSAVPSKHGGLISFTVIMPVLTVR